MAPIRRYLRITKYSVLEVRIYLDNPALSQSWLLNPRDPVLPRVVEAVRPLVLPKLREESERAKKKGTKKRAIKDVVTKDDFEVAIFLTETETRHSLLFKNKRFRDKRQSKLRSNSKKLTGGDSAGAAIAVGDDDDDEGAGDDSEVELIRTVDGDEIPMVRREESDEEDSAAVLRSIPEAPKADDGGPREGSGATERRRRETGAAKDDENFEMIDSAEASPDPGSDSDTASRSTRNKGVRKASAETDEKKKKLAMDISYEGFAIYGRVLCLVVKKRGTGVNSKGAITGAGTGASAASRAAGQAKMENWIASTQVASGTDQGEDTA